jgi:Reverse transcriptase (RNA-dependent DNA polymerase)
LTLLNELDLKEELSNYKIFDKLNNEKITPHFMRMTKTINSSPNLDVICDNNDTPFAEDSDRENFITNFYGSLYKKPDGEPILNDISIEDFLGNVKDKEEVQNSKINNREKELLDRPLSLNEFDIAIKSANKKSSPGTDGISNKFIAKFWNFFRTPLLRYANCCYEKGQLTHLFKTAKIRLIPKKGDLKKIGNWRPISLLNCFYKLISRVITNRLKKVIDKITKVGQYGYSNTKQCQEVLIGLLTDIHQAKTENQKGLLVSLDIKKAFDSISHQFLERALVFFNFGANFINWVKLISTNREACIILSKNKLGKNFKLERGNAQGDTISPFLFNICYQILLFKFEYELQIKSVPLNVAAAPCAPDPAAPPAPVSLISKKVFTFADDCNLLIKRCRESLLMITEILRNFATISGLECNIEKSNYLEIGDTENLIDNIGTGIGIQKKMSLKILGMEISNDKNLILTNNADYITRKINEQVSKWCRFNLSLPGRIRIAKSMLYSQINYLGCFLDFSENSIQLWETIIGNFVSANLRISARRIFLATEKGGLGLPGLKNFLESLKCAWVARARSSTDASWKEVFRKISTVTFFTQNLHFVNRVDGCLRAISNAFSGFKKGYARSNNNYLKMVIFEDPLFTINTRNGATLNNDDINLAWPLNVQNKIKNLSVGDLYTNHQVKTRTILNEFLGAQISPAFYRKLSGIARTARIRYHHDDCAGGISLQTFLGSWKKGSKKFRKYIDYDGQEFISHNIVKFASNADIVIGLNCAKILNNLWCKNFFSNQTGTFLFKLTNNTLPFNTVLSHFVRGHSRNCTFCDILRNPDFEEETCLHLFYDCNAAETIREQFFRWLVSDQNFNLSRHDFFCCIKDDNKNKSFILMVIIRLFMQSLWEAKLRKNLPDLETIKHFIFGEFDIMKKCNTIFAATLQASGINLSRRRLG